MYRLTETEITIRPAACSWCCGDLRAFVSQAGCQMVCVHCGRSILMNRRPRGAEPSSMRIPQIAAVRERVPMVSDVSPALLRHTEQGARGGKSGRVYGGEIARPRMPVPL